MTIYNPALEYFLEQQIIETFFGIFYFRFFFYLCHFETKGFSSFLSNLLLKELLNDSNSSWPDRLEFGRTLNTIFKLSQKACNDAILCDGQVFA